MIAAAAREGLPALSLVPLAMARSGLGDSETATRLPTLIAALLLLALVFRIARCEGGRELAALATWITGISYLTLALCGVEVFDLLATLSIVGAWGGVQIAKVRRSTRPQWWEFAAAGSGLLSIALAGPIALVLWLAPLACFADRSTALRFLGVAMVGVIGWVTLVTNQSSGFGSAVFAPETASQILRVVLLAVAPGLLFIGFAGRTARGTLARRLFAEPVLRAWGLALLLPGIALFIVQPLMVAADIAWVRALAAHSAGGLLAATVPPMALIASLAIRESLDRAVTFPMRVALFGGTWALLIGGGIALFFVWPERFDGGMGLFAAAMGALILLLSISRSGSRLDPGFVGSLRSKDPRP